MAIFGVYGTGGYGREVAPIVREQLSHEDRLVFVDDMASGSVNGFPVLELSAFAESDDIEKHICIAVSDGQVRMRLAEQCSAKGISFFSGQHSSMICMDGNVIGDGAIFSPNTIVTSNALIGRHFQCNIYSYVAHDCVIGDYVTFAPAVRCNGNVTIGDFAYIGTGAVLKQGLTIGAGATIGMGAVVTKDVPAGETWIGNPARSMTASAK